MLKTLRRSDFSFDERRLEAGWCLPPEAVHVQELPE